jgi:uncharacterized protein (TIGR00369 family)
MESSQLELGELLDMEIVSASEDEVVGTIDVSEKHHQPFGYLHGGVSVVLAESVASIGAELASPEGSHAFGMEINANHVKPVKKGLIRAVAEPVHKGKTSHVWSTEIHDEQDRLVCVSRCTLAIRPE